MRDLRNLFLLLVLTSVSLACREEKTAKNLIYVGPKSELTDIDMVYSDSARTVVRMVTPSQITLYSEDRVYPKEVKLWFTIKWEMLPPKLEAIPRIFLSKEIRIN